MKNIPDKRNWIAQRRKSTRINPRSAKRKKNIETQSIVRDFRPFRNMGCAQDCPMGKYAEAEFKLYDLHNNRKQ